MYIIMMATMIMNVHERLSDCRDTPFNLLSPEQAELCTHTPARARLIFSCTQFSKFPTLLQQYKRQEVKQKKKFAIAFWELKET